MSLPIGSRNAGFPTTRWSVVAAAGQPSGADEALGTLHGTCRPAVYAHVRHRGYRREDAGDIARLTVDATIAGTWDTACAVDFAAPDPVYGRREALGRPRPTRIA